MNIYFAAAALRSYLFDVLVWGVILTIVFIMLSVFLKRTRRNLIVFGALLILSAFPAAVMMELSIGWRSEPSSYQGLGWIIGAVVALVGILIIVFSKKLSKERNVK